MPRNLPGAVQSAVQDSHVAGLIFARFDFASGAVRVHNGGAVVTWGGFNWQPLGDHGKLVAMPESLSGDGHVIEFQLSGLDQDILQAVTSVAESDYFGREAEVYFGLFNSETCAPLADPTSLGWGYMDSMDIEFDTGSAVVTLRVASEQERWDEASNWRMNHEWQQRFKPGDRGFEYQHTEGDAVWGGQPVRTGRRGEDGGAGVGRWGGGSQSSLPDFFERLLR